jgi:hypothetical protein
VSPVWLIPCTLAVVTAVVLVAITRAVRSELAVLSEHLRGLSRLRDRAHAVRIESERTARATELTLEALVPPAPQ